MAKKRLRMITVCLEKGNRLFHHNFYPMSVLSTFNFELHRNKSFQN